MEYIITFYEDKTKAGYSREITELKIRTQLIPLVSVVEEILNSLGINYTMEFNEFQRNDDTKLKAKCVFKLNTLSENKIIAYPHYPTNTGTVMVFNKENKKFIGLYVNEKGIITNKQEVINGLKKWT